MNAKIWLLQYKTTGELLKRGANVSYVCYNYKGVYNQVYVENEDFLILKEQEINE